jgi:hypothetical protein
MKIVSYKTWCKKKFGISTNGHSLTLLHENGFTEMICYEVDWRNCISVKDFVADNLTELGVNSEAVYYYKDIYRGGEHYRRIYIFWKAENEVLRLPESPAVK